MEPQAPPKLERPQGKVQWAIIERLRKAKNQSLKLPKGTTTKTKSELRAIRALADKGIVVIMGDRYARIR